MADSSQPPQNSRRCQRCPALLQTHAPYGSATASSGCSTLATARTPCSSDPDHSFVLGIVLDSYNASDYPEDSRLGVCNRVQHVQADGYWQILPHAPRPSRFCCRHAKDRTGSQHIIPSLLTAHHGRSQCCQGPDRVTAHHPLAANGTPREESALGALNRPWLKFLAFPSQALSEVLNNDEEKSRNFIQYRPKTKQMNKQKKFTGNKSQKYKKGESMC